MHVKKTGLSFLRCSSYLKKAASLFFFFFNFNLVFYLIFFPKFSKIYCQDKNLTISPIKINISGMLHYANPSGAKFLLI